MLQSFTRAANFRCWLGRPDCPAAIQECKKLFDKWYGPSTSDSEHSSLSEDGIFDQCVAPEDITDSSRVSVPLDLCHLVSGTKVTLWARLKHNSVVYTWSFTHLGNSLVQFYLGGNAYLH
jgi:hypothetical protein